MRKEPHLWLESVRHLMWAILVVWSSGLAAEPDIDLPFQDGQWDYPIGMTDISYPRVQWEITTRANGRPLLIFLPYERGPHPVVIFNHGRSFQMPVGRVLGVNRALLESVTKKGWALALPVRSGYYLDPHVDEEAVRCNNPSYEEFVTAGESAGQDIKAVVDYLAEQSFIDSERIIVAGTSAGGFASVASLLLIDNAVLGVISVNGGRCGKRGPSVGGVHHIASYYESISQQTSSPVYFLAGSLDDVILLQTTIQLHDAFQRERDTDTAHLYTNPRGNHNFRSMLPVFERAFRKLTQGR